MSLRVWLPLDGNLENLGASNILATGTDITINSSGKIGSCYSFNGSSSYIKLDKSLLSNSTTEFSFSCWAKFNSTTSGCLFSSRTGINNTGITLFVNNSGNILFDIGNERRTKAYSFSTGVWYHITFTYRKGDTKKIYINGMEIDSIGSTNTMTAVSTTNAFIGASQNAATTVNANYLNGYLNDVRIYNHALSAAEVHEISLGLVLHYKLDNNGHRNLISSNAAKTVTLGESATNAYTGYWYLDTYVKALEILKEGTPYTVIYDYSVNTLTSTSAYFYSQINTARCAPSLAATGIRTANTGTVKENFVMTAAQATYSSSFRFRIRFYGAAGDSVTISNLRICLGTYLECDYVSDCSGYGHNGTIVGSPILNSDTPRYSTDIQFPGTAYIKITSPSTEIRTISLWAKWNSIPSGQSIIYVDLKSKTGLGLASNGIIVNANQTGNTFNKSSLVANTWYHFVIVSPNGSSNATRKFYINGVELTATSSTNSWSYTIDELLLGKRSTSSDGFNGKISDFRMYATALSADDIKQLYQVSAKVDNLQGLHTFEIKETNRNLLAGRLWSNGYSQHNPNADLFTNFNSKGEYQFTANSTSAGSEYIPINPTGHTYEYDYTISVNTGNQFYIGFERYDADKTARSNNACVYTYATKPSTDVVKQHFTGTVDLSTDGTNPCAFIALRILNGWSGTTSGVTGTATIHSFSLREIGTKLNPKLTKQGLFIEEELKEETNMKLHKNGIIETNTLIEK